MNDPGLKSLGDFIITSAGTQTGEWVTGLDGMLSALLSLRLSWGAGGTTVRVYLQSSPDGGTTAVDCACVLFGAASEHALLNFSALTPKLTQVTPTDGSMADDTAIDSLISDRLRVKIVSTGSYTSSTILSTRVVVR